MLMIKYKIMIFLCGGFQIRFADVNDFLCNDCALEYRGYADTPQGGYI